MCYISYKVIIEFREVWTRHIDNRNRILRHEQFNNRYDILTIDKLGRWVHDKLCDNCYRIFGSVHHKDMCLTKLWDLGFKAKFYYMPKP